MSFFKEAHLQETPYAEGKLNPKLPKPKPRILDTKVKDHRKADSAKSS